MQARTLKPVDDDPLERKVQAHHLKSENYARYLKLVNGERDLKPVDDDPLGRKVQAHHWKSDNPDLSWHQVDWENFNFRKTIESPYISSKSQSQLMRY